MILNVENFGKIKHASIDVSGYSIFVGDNNSGKSYLMQLIYGILNAIRNLHEFSMIPSFHVPTDENPMEVNTDNFREILDIINVWLDKNKNRIVKATFNFDIGIEKIWVSNENDCPNIVLKVAGKDDLDWTSEKDFSCYNIFIDNKKRGGVAFAKELPPGMTENQQINRFLCMYVFEILTYGKNYNNELLYLPACRSGLNLLYKDTVGEYASKYAIRSSFMEFRDTESQNPGKKLGLTKPVFDYMLFLQRYKKDSEKEIQNKPLISFINEKILNGGRIDRDKDGEIRYFMKKNVALPLHVSSSMVNEISPIIHFLTSTDRIGNIFYDEIETSQHPKTQLQLARLLNRLVNSGYKMIVSTHSDTMAAAISNLVTLSFCENSLVKAKELGYEKDDMLKKDCVHAYQFENENGKTVVKELEKFVNQGIGYDFTIFNKTNDKLLADYQVIARDDASVI